MVFAEPAATTSAPPRIAVLNVEPWHFIAKIYPKDETPSPMGIHRSDAAVAAALLRNRGIMVNGGWVNRSGRFKPLLGRWAYTSDGQRGLVQLVVLHHSTNTVVGPIIPNGPSPAWDAWNKQFPPSVQWHAEQYGFGFECGPILAINATHHAIENGTRLWVMMPFGAVAAAFAVLPLIALWNFVGRRPIATSDGKCAMCGYDLRATPDRCPECGAIPTNTGLRST
jgi:hypothetical protein